MISRLAPSQYVFPNPIEHDPEGEGLICMGADLNPSTLYEAYTTGLFPWFNEGEPICWWSPEPRCIILPHEFSPSKTLLRSMKKWDYQITINHAFERVIRACALPRSYADATWITEDIIQGYCGMFKAGYAYSIEVWDNEELIGGLYGTTIGKGCFGESMFSTRTDASKMAFYTLMLLATAQNCPWVDCQLPNEHLMSLGAITVSREEFIKSLNIVTKSVEIDWQIYQGGILSSKEIALNKKLT